MANTLPMTLRFYRSLSSAAAPLAPAVIRQRLKHGKEDPERIGERRGLSRDIQAERAAGLDSRRQRRRSAGGGQPDRTAACAQYPHPPDLGHRDVGGDRRAAVPARRHPSIRALRLAALRRRFLDHWRPSLALFIESDLWPNLILSSAARRLPMVLINGRMSPRSFPRWRRVSGDDIGAAGHASTSASPSRRVDAERFTALGSRNVVTTGNLKLDVPAPPADPAKLERLMATTRGRPIIVAASTHPGEDEILCEAHRTLSGFFPSLLTVIVPRHPDRGPAIARTVATSGLAPGVAVTRRICRPLRPRSMSRIRSASSACSTGSRRSSSWADRWSSMAGRIRSRRSSWALRSCTVRTCINFADVYEALDCVRRRAAGRRSRSAGEAARSVAGRSGRAATRSQCGRPRVSSENSAARWSARWPRSSPTCCNCGSRWEPADA